MGCKFHDINNMNEIINVFALKGLYSFEDNIQLA